MTTTWTPVPKATIPSKQTVNIVAGSPIGLLLALTYSTASSYTSGGWINVPKAVVPTNWSNVPKAT